MSRTFSPLLLPALLAGLLSTHAAAQVRIGVDLGPVSIRIAPEAPPPPRVEVRMVRPDPRHVWIQGYWDRRDDRWMWAPGRWERPSQAGSLWVRPRYRREGDYWRYEPAHWSHQQMVEGDDYQRWHREYRERRGHDDDRDDDRGRRHDNRKQKHKHKHKDKDRDRD